MASSAEADLLKLKAENSTLREEVAQLQADKEFVWSLWKRLQVASPDLTQAIAEVVKREKEKNEVKDRKVLNILNVKDETIAALKRTIEDQSSEIEDLMQKKTEDENIFRKLEREFQEMSDRVEFQTDQLRSKENKEKTVDDLHRHLVEGFEKNKLELNRQLSDHRAENSVLRAENADLNAIRLVHESKIKGLQEDIKDVRAQYEKVFLEFEAAKKTIYGHDVHVRQLQMEHESKIQEVIAARKELEDLWENHRQCKQHAAEQASVINQLQTLQQDTQKMLKTQTDCHTVEYHSLHAMYKELETRTTEMRSTEMELRKQLMTKDTAIEELQNTLANDPTRTVKVQTDIEHAATQVTSTILEYEYKLESIQTERDMLRDRLKEKSKALRTLQTDAAADVDLDLTPVKLQSIRTPSRDGQTPSRDRVAMRDARSQARYEMMEKRLKNTQQLLKLKVKEVEELRTAHTKRLERLKFIQTNYEIVKEDLASLQTDSKRPGGDKKKRCDVKSLRKEDNDSVWNELTYFRQENKALMMERLQLQEEVDVMQVQRAQDAASILELQTSLEQAMDEKQVAIEERNRLLDPQLVIEQQLYSTKHELMGKESTIESLTKEKTKLQKMNEEINDERRKLRSELNQSLHELAAKRIEVCDVKSQLNALQKSLRKMKKRRVVAQRQKQCRSVSFQSSSDCLPAQVGEEE